MKRFLSAAVLMAVVGCSKGKVPTSVAPIAPPAAPVVKAASPTPSMVMKLQDGSTLPLVAWEQGKDEDAWLAEAQSKADEMRQAVAVIQNGKLVAMVNPR